MIHIKTREERWKFPEQIKFGEVTKFSEMFEKRDKERELIFDLSETTNIHSSFIGFLIHTKFILNNEGKDIQLLVSFTVERILIMLNIYDYFSDDAITILKKPA